MWNLAIECSGLSASVALVQANGRCHLVKLPKNLGSAEGLAVIVRNALSQSGLAAPQLISVTSGPGSFTGLRVGLTTAKTLAMAWSIPIVGVDTLEVIAHQVFAAQDLATTEKGACVIPVINAFRGQVFSAAWSIDRDVPQRLCQSAVVSASAWRDSPPGALGIDAEACRVAGPGLEVYQPAEDALTTTADDQLWAPSALQVAQLGISAFHRGEATTARLLQPNYIRATAAEEKSKAPVASPSRN